MVVRTGSPQRDLPASFDKWNMIFKCYGQVTRMITCTKAGKSYEVIN